MSQPASSEQQSFIKRNRLPLSVAAGAGAAVLAAAGLIENGHSKPAPKANAITQPSASATPEASAAPTETTAPVITPTTLPSHQAIATHRATQAPKPTPTHAEVKPSSAPFNEKAAAAKEVTRMQHREKGQVLNILGMAAGERLEFAGPVYGEPSKSGEQYNYLVTTRIQHPEVITLENGTQSICGAVTNPNDIRCVFPVDGKYTIVNNTSGATREIAATNLQIVQMEVASVDESGFAHAANGDFLATNPTES